MLKEKEWKKCAIFSIGLSWMLMQEYCYSCFPRRKITICLYHLSMAIMHKVHMLHIYLPYFLHRIFFLRNYVQSFYSQNRSNKKKWIARRSFHLSVVYVKLHLFYFTILCDEEKNRLDMFRFHFVCRHINQNI